MSQNTDKKIYKYVYICLHIYISTVMDKAIILTYMRRTAE